MALLSSLFQTVTDVDADKEIIRRRAYGMIEVRDQSLHAIHFRPYPKLISIAEIKWANYWKSRSTNESRPDRVVLYFNQPIMHRNFLSLNYFVSDSNSTLASIAVCLSVLDYIAMVKRTDAILTEITNPRIKDRHLSHFGWETYLEKSSKRNWIKRFYGQYPERFVFQGLPPVLKFPK